MTPAPRKPIPETTCPAIRKLSSAPRAVSAVSMTNMAAPAAFERVRSQPSHPLPPLAFRSDAVPENQRQRQTNRKVLSKSIVVDLRQLSEWKSHAITRPRIYHAVRVGGAASQFEICGVLGSWQWINEALAGATGELGRRAYAKILRYEEIGQESPNHQNSRNDIQSSRPVGRKVFRPYRDIRPKITSQIPHRVHDSNPCRRCCPG